MNEEDQIIQKLRIIQQLRIITLETVLVELGHKDLLIKTMRDLMKKAFVLDEQSDKDQE